MLKRVDQLKSGDLVDLEGDKYADAYNKHPEFGYLLQEVVEVIPETPNCIAIGFEGFDVVGFPPGHMVQVHLQP